MSQIRREEIAAFIETHIKDYHAKIFDRLSALKLPKILKRKNPYLFKAKNLNVAQELIKSILDAHLSSQKEGIFGSFLEELAIFICSKVYNGHKASSEGIDLEFEKDDIRYKGDYLKLCGQMMLRLLGLGNSSESLLQRFLVSTHHG